MTFSNFILNTFASILRNATAAPDTNAICALVDAVAGRRDTGSNPVHANDVPVSSWPRQVHDGIESDDESFHSAVENDGGANEDTGAESTNAGTESTNSVLKTVSWYGAGGVPNSAGGKVDSAAGRGSDARAILTAASVNSKSNDQFLRAAVDNVDTDVALCRSVRSANNGVERKSSDSSTDSTVTAGSGNDTGSVDAESRGADGSAFDTSAIEAEERPAGDTNADADNLPPSISDHHRVSSVPTNNSVGIPFIDDTFENADKIQYPNGEHKYKLRGLNHQIAWATLQYSGNRSKNVVTGYKKCLGVFACPHPGCLFTARPLLPEGKGSRNKNSFPRIGKVTHCKLHSSYELVHVPCPVTITTRTYPASDYVQVEHHGVHDHLKPAPKRPGERAKKEFQKEVKENPQRKPLSYVVGNSNKEPMWKKDKAFINIDRVRYMRRKELQDLAYASPQEITAFDKETNLDLIVGSSLKASNGCLLLQTDMMTKVQKYSETAVQTDVIEGFVLDPLLPNACLCVTSTFCGVRQKWVPTMFGILFGKSGPHFGKYFKTQLKRLKYKDFEDFANNSYGTVCDFSDAERKGFRLALEKVFEGMPDDAAVERVFTFCTIHFDRSECRIRRNHAAVPRQRQDEFKFMVRRLKDPMERAVFDELVAEIKREFPKTKKWLNWYLHKDRAKFIFPAMAREDFNSDCRNTNAEESMGRTIQMACEHENPSILQTYFLCYQLAAKHDMEYSCACQGLPITFGAPRQKRAYHNDGKAPEKTDELLGKKQRNIGRPRNARNKAPSGDSVVDLTLSIIWSYEFVTDEGKTIKATLTCAMDTVLMGFFLLRKYDDELFLDFRRDENLTRVLDLIQCRDYSRARHEWMLHAESASKVRTSRRGSGAATGAGVTLAVRSEGTDGSEKWDCSTTPFDQISAVKLFHYYYVDEYGECSNGDFECPYFDKYDAESNKELSAREKHSKFVSVPVHQMHSIQAEVLDKYYNSNGDVVDCGAGTSNSTNRNGQLQVPCGGSRGRRIVISEPMPPLLMIEQVTNAGVTSHSMERSRLTSMDQIEHLLKVNGTSYVLVYVVLSSSAHFRGVAIIHGKYLMYDGMFGGNRLRWIQPNTKFSSSTDDYWVSSLWYRKCHPGSVDEANLGSIAGDRDEDSSSNGVSSGKSASKRSYQSSEGDASGPRTKKKTQAKIPVDSKSTKRKKIPLGISIRPVSNKGPQPICKYCHSEIERGEWHTIKNEKRPDANKNWHQSLHYHFSCFRHLSCEEQDQLIAIVQNSNDLDESMKKEVASEIMYHRER